MENAGRDSSSSAALKKSPTLLSRLLSFRGSSLFIIGGILITVEILARLDLLPIFFPAPSVVAKAFVEMILSGDGLLHLVITIRRLFVGLAIGATAGLLFGLWMGSSNEIYRLFSPVFSSVQPIPRIALLPLYIVIFGLGENSTIMVIATAAFFPLLLNAISGVRQIDPTYLEVAHNYALSPWQVFWLVRIRGSMPSLLTGFRLAANRGMVLAIAVELLTSNDGLGSLVDLAWRTLRIDDLYASLILIGLVGVVLDIVTNLMEKRFADWHAKEKDTAIE